MLRFRVANHRSIRDPVELSLVRSTAKGVAPADGDWRGATTRVAGIYGANASGKSTLLHALNFASDAVQESAWWGNEDRFPHHPYLLDNENRHRPSSYELDVVVAGVRYTYGFESTANGIQAEWLYSYPARRRRMLFERSGEGDGQQFSFGRTLPGENITISKLVSATSLFLSTAANSNHPVLKPIHRGISYGIRYARFDHFDRRERIDFSRQLLEDGKTFRRAETLLRFADLGIVGIKLEHKEVDGGLREFLQRISDALPGTVAAEDKLERVEEAVARLSKTITFAHGVADDRGTLPSLTLEQESSGTVAWLSLAVPALDVLRGGGVFLVDEIDASLHPRLTSALIGMFKDPVVNPSGAQLVFTSHDTALMGNLLGGVFESDEIWFTEKRADGVTELYALAEFATRKGDNFERRYLQGRYGAVPMISADELRLAFADSE